MRVPMHLPVNSQRGQSLLMVTLSMGMIFGGLSLAVDVGWAYFRRETAQAAADGAALAAVRAAMKSSPGSYTCGTDGVWCGSPAGTATACGKLPGSPSTSFDNACMMAAQNGLSGQTVTVQANTTSSVPTVSGPTVSYWVTVRVYHNGGGFFGGILPSTSGGLTVSSRSSAAALMTSSGAGGCVYILDPRASQSFLAGNDAQIILNCGLYVNSSANSASPSAAMYLTGSAYVQATTIEVVGSYYADNAGHASPTPTTGATAASDPFASLPSPTPAGTCSSGNFTAWQSTAYTPAPGTYCGFTLGNGMNAVLSPGTYIINGGTFSVQGGSALTATGGVLIYLTGGATANIANGATVTLSAQSSGTYQGVLFYQDRTMTSPGASTLAGGASMTFTGSLYFPHALLNINNGTNTAVMAVVADEVNFQGGAHFQADTNGAKTGIMSTYGLYLLE
jgi:hypothetical protein